MKGMLMSEYKDDAEQIADHAMLIANRVSEAILGAVNIAGPCRFDLPGGWNNYARALGLATVVANLALNATRGLEDSEEKALEWFDWFTSQVPIAIETLCGRFALAHFGLTRDMLENCDVCPAVDRALAHFGLTPDMVDDGIPF